VAVDEAYPESHMNVLNGPTRRRRANEVRAVPKRHGGELCALLARLRGSMFGSMLSKRVAATRAFSLATSLLSSLALARCGDEGVAPPCDDWMNSAQLARRAAQERAAVRECSVDADCVRAYFRLRCVDDCGEGTAAVAASAVPALGVEVEAIDRRSCGEFERADCPFIVQPCVLDPTPPVAVCRDGQCELEFVDER
jgi:hypothetical protein